MVKGAHVDMASGPGAGVREAVRLAGGTQVHLARVLGCTQQAVSLWLAQGWVPLRRAVEIEAVLGVPRGRLIRPRLRELVDLPPVT